MAIPIVKWAGGKRLILPQLRRILPQVDEIDKHKYYEPFFGGGALFFDLEPRNANINDINGDLMNVYIQVRDNLNPLLLLLDEHLQNHSEDYFYKVRNADRLAKYKDMSSLEKAARMIYLNRTCYNGLYRVNLQGFFNTPSGHYDDPYLYDRNNITRVSKLLGRCRVKIQAVDYWDSIKHAKSGSIIYLDPPYDFGEETGFVSYTRSGFGYSDLELLKKRCDRLVDRGCYIVISNNDNDKVRALFIGDGRYRVYKIHSVSAPRMINCIGVKRQRVNEVLIVGELTNKIADVGVAE